MGTDAQAQELLRGETLGHTSWRYSKLEGTAPEPMNSDVRPKLRHNFTLSMYSTASESTAVSPYDPLANRVYDKDSPCAHSQDIPFSASCSDDDSYPRTSVRLNYPYAYTESGSEKEATEHKLVDPFEAKPRFGQE